MGFEFNFTLENVIPATKIMLVGMGGIFLVLGVIYLASIILQRIFPEEKK